MLKFVPECAHDLVSLLVGLLVGGVAVKYVEDAGLLPFVILFEAGDEVEIEFVVEGQATFGDQNFVQGQ